MARKRLSMFFAFASSISLSLCQAHFIYLLLLTMPNSDSVDVIKVTELNGTNYQDWAGDMRSLLVYEALCIKAPLL